MSPYKSCRRKTEQSLPAHGFTLIELLVIASHHCCDRLQDILKKIKTKRMSYSPAHGQVKLCSFTLIELLVVIAIIAILAAMLLPALQSARERGRTASCLGNLKEVSTAIQMYSDAYNDFLPPAKYNKDSFCRWHYIINRFFNSSKSTTEEIKTFPDYLRCPSFKNYKLSSNFPVEEQHVSYGMNNATGDNNALPASSFIKRNKVYSPSQRPLIADNYRLNYDTNLNNASQTAWNWYSLSGDNEEQVVAHQMHRKMPNVGFVDGHVSGPEPTTVSRWPKKMVQFHNYDKW